MTRKKLTEMAIMIEALRGTKEAEILTIGRALMAK